MEQPQSLQSPSPLGTAIRRHWWIFVVRGVLGLALGVFALLLPGATIAAIVLLTGAFLIVDGAIAMYKALMAVRTDPTWWLLLLAGIIGVVVGASVFRWPGLTALTLGYLVGFWAILTGLLEVGVAFALRKTIRGEWFYIIFGIVSVVFGVFVYAAPGLGLAYLTLMIAFYGFVGGVALITMGIRLRRLGP